MQEHELVVEACLELEAFAWSNKMTHLARAMREAITAARLDAVSHAAVVGRASGSPAQACYTNASNVTPLWAKQKGQRNEL